MNLDECAMHRRPHRLKFECISTSLAPSVLIGFGFWIVYRVHHVDEKVALLRDAHSIETRKQTNHRFILVPWLSIRILEEGRDLRTIASHQSSSITERTADKLLSLRLSQLLIEVDPLEKKSQFRFICRSSWEDFSVKIYLRIYLRKKSQFRFICGSKREEISAQIEDQWQKLLVQSVDAHWWKSLFVGILWSGSIFFFVFQKKNFFRDSTPIT